MGHNSTACSILGTVKQPKQDSSGVAEVLVRSK